LPPRRVAPEQEIVDEIYRKVGEYGGQIELYSALVKRVRDLLRESHDRDQVELVCMIVVDQAKDDFQSVYSLSWPSYEFVREKLRIPDGAWAYALKAYRAEDGQFKSSLEYWLGYWKDAESEADRAKAKEMLEKLGDTNAIGLFDVML